MASCRRPPSPKTPRSSSPRHWRSALAGGAALLVAASWLAYGSNGCQSWRADRHVQRGARAESEDAADAARSAYRQALRLRPDHANARLALAELELKTGRPEHAFLEFQTLVELHPRDVAGWHGVSRVYAQAGLWREA